MTSYVIQSKNTISDEVLQLAESLLSCTSPCEHSLLIKKKATKKRSRHVYKAELNNTVYYFKMYTNHSVLKFLQEIPRGSRASRAFDMSVTLKSKGFKLAQPVAAFTNKIGAEYRRSVFITEELAGEDFLHRFIEDTPNSAQTEIAGRLLALYKQLIDQKIYHKDLNLTNCRMIDNQLHLIDVDDIRKVFFFHPFNLVSNFSKQNIALVLLMARYPQTWFKNTHREEMIRNLCNRYLPDFCTPMLLSFISTQGFKKAQQFVSGPEQQEALRKLVAETK